MIKVNLLRKIFKKHQMLKRTSKVLQLKNKTVPRSRKLIEE